MIAIFTGTSLPAHGRRRGGAAGSPAASPECGGDSSTARRRREASCARSSGPDMMETAGATSSFRNEFLRFALENQNVPGGLPQRLGRLEDLRQPPPLGPIFVQRGVEIRIRPLQESGPQFQADGFVFAFGHGEIISKEPSLMRGWLKKNLRESCAESSDG